jgi:hypothetical protein
MFQVRLAMGVNFLEFNGRRRSVDSKMFVVILLISKIYQLSLQRCL